MNSESIRQLLQRQPFEPFEIRMTHGENHLIRHPEMLMLVGSRAVIGYPETDRVAILSLLHIASIEMMQTAH